MSNFIQVIVIRLIFSSFAHDMFGFNITNFLIDKDRLSSSLVHYRIFFLLDKDWKLINQLQLIKLIKAALQPNALFTCFIELKLKEINLWYCYVDKISSPFTAGWLLLNYSCIWNCSLLPISVAQAMQFVLAIPLTAFNTTLDAYIKIVQFSSEYRHLSFLTALANKVTFSTTRSSGKKTLLLINFLMQSPKPFLWLYLRKYFILKYILLKEKRTSKLKKHFITSTFLFFKFLWNN